MSCGVRQTYGVLGFCFQVVSSAFPVHAIQEAMLTFIESIEENVIGGMSEELYLNNVTALVNSKLEPELSLNESATRNWAEIDDSRYDFQLHAKQAELLLIRQKVASETHAGKLTTLSQRENVKRFCKKLLADAPKVLILQATRQSSADPESDGVGNTQHLKNCVWSDVESVESLHTTSDTN